MRLRRTHCLLRCLAKVDAGDVRLHNFVEELVLLRLRAIEKMALHVVARCDDDMCEADGGDLQLQGDGGLVRGAMCVRALRLEVDFPAEDPPNCFPQGLVAVDYCLPRL